ncbi:E3 ubiquitin-protein ligase HOS1-like [Cucurbita maxima]|uniref:E3 ubiquitin-protein ligase HOS1-like n=1 Tax=Cucurbita maxima TaxID=3661 RepID=A0A6J1K2I0_CUCMA|nr:E3 ubiquitin-protein ligase HOS1-like [Cucurbita maxima]
MDRQIYGHAVPSTSTNGRAALASTSSSLQPDYSSRAVQEALKHLASIDLIELCNEAKVEHCRATRDLRSCGRDVQYVLNSCGHASLCEECCQRCDTCPICRVPVPKSSARTHLRLFYECVEAALIPKNFKEQASKEEDGEDRISTDVQRLYSLFDVALENNMVSLICHYVRDVCMDESAVSSDPVIAFLLDEVAVKDWCKRASRNIITELQEIYNSGVEGMRSRLSILLKFSVHLAGISNVLEVLDSSFRSSHSAQLEDLHNLHEDILKIKQHMEIMMWCIRHQFLENVRSCHSSFTSWLTAVRERKSAAIRRSWPDALDDSADSSGREGSLFIEDALENLDIEQWYSPDVVDGLEIASLANDGTPIIFRSKIGGSSGCYPFENLRVAVDVLFLRGSSDVFVAKKAILLYYLFDRHWMMPDEKWRHVVEDFAASFSITRHSVLESFVFYLLDDHTDEALQEACRLLPEISGPATHPKIAQVLLEWKNPDTALMVLRWSGRDSMSTSVSLVEAVIGVRVRVECGLLTEAFMYQKILCNKVRDRKKYEEREDEFDNAQSKFRRWEDWVKILVTEICFLCIRRNFVDRMIELPWNSDEEKHLHKCLMEWSTANPSTTIGSLLFVYYLQRFRYHEAYQVNLLLQKAEQGYISESSVVEEVLSRMRSTSHWRAGLVDKFMELLPEAQQLEIKSRKSPNVGVNSEEVDVPRDADLSGVQEQSLSSILIPSAVNSTVLQRNDSKFIVKPPVFDTPGRLGGTFNHSKIATFGSPSVHIRLFASKERVPKIQNNLHKSSNFQDMFGSGFPVAMNISPSEEDTRSSSRVLPNSQHFENDPEKLALDKEPNGITNQVRNTSPYSRRITANPIYNTPSSKFGLLDVPSRGVQENGSSKNAVSARDNGTWNIHSIDDPMEISSHGGQDSAADVQYMNGAPRWRSDEASDEEEPNLDRGPRMVRDKATLSGTRRSRFTKR